MIEGSDPADELASLAEPEDPDQAGRKERVLFQAARRVALDVKALQEENAELREALAKEVLEGSAMRRDAEVLLEERRLSDAIDELGEPGPPAAPVQPNARSLHPAWHLGLALLLGFVLVYVVPFVVPGRFVLDASQVLLASILILVLSSPVTFLLSYWSRRRLETHEAEAGVKTG